MIKERNVKLEEELINLPITGDVKLDHMIRKNRKLEKEIEEYKNDVNRLCNDLKIEFEEKDVIL
jgi:myo-inositol-1-phosphate synthase